VPWDPDSSIVGTISLNPADSRFLLFDINPDTAPANTLDPVNAIINPLLSGPSHGLPAPVYGQRYLLTESTGDTDNPLGTNPAAWVGTNNIPLVAKKNDIIEYDGAKWRVAFNSTNLTDIQYVTNITTSIQYRWDGANWFKSIDGLYQEGSWNLIL
jgi:hypothetical protein